MSREIVHTAVVGEDGAVTIKDPLLPAGAVVTVKIAYEPAMPPRPLASYFGSAKGLYKSPEEVIEFLRAERDAWDD